MNRRDFLRSALAGFAILPGAGRLWKAVREPEYSCVMAEPQVKHTLHSVLYADIYEIKLQRERFGVPAEEISIFTDTKTAQIFRENCERFERMTPGERVNCFFFGNPEGTVPHRPGFAEWERGLPVLT